MEDKQIVELYWERSETAISETEKKYGRYCHYIAYQILANDEDAKEVVNDTYLKAWNTIPPTRPNVLRAFLCKITRNLSLNRLRDIHRMGRDAELTVSLTELEGCLALPEENGEELAELLSDFLKAQDKEDRLLFMGRYWYSYTMDDLADSMKLTKKAVYMRLHKTRERLRAFLAERGYRV